MRWWRAEGRAGLRLLMCDEPTSCLDVASDHLAHDVLTSLASTVMITEHRLVHVERFDRVVVMDRGTLVEQGSARELGERPGSVLAQLRAQQEQQGAAPNKREAARRPARTPECCGSFVGCRAARLWHVARNTPSGLAAPKVAP